MLHLRITAPPERAADVVALIAANVGVSNVAVMPGASVRPPGDLILVDLARECADDVIDALAAPPTVRTSVRYTSRSH
ncbi:hypothetical protein BH20ACT5_BH20ACT5_18470 [soil metagenome]